MSFELEESKEYSQVGFDDILTILKQSKNESKEKALN
jgi:hypothetical protein